MKRIAKKRIANIFLVAFAATSIAHGALAVERPVPSGAREAQPHQGEWIRIASAQQLLGQELLSKDGRRVGRIEAVMLDLTSGDAVYAIASPEGDHRGGAIRMLVPFGALALERWSEGPIQVEQSYDRIIQDSPGVAVDRLKEWMNRDRVAESYRLYGVPTPYGYVIPPDPNRERLPDRYLLVRPSQVPGSAATKETANNALADELRGATVHQQDGDLLGEVEFVMLDLANGRVAFVLVSVGKDWVSVPLQAIAWSSDRGLTVQGATSPEAFQPLKKTDLPTRLRRSQLEALYKRFDLRPYEEQSRLN